jgi:hypothetical protein
MQAIRTTIYNKIRTPEFITGTATGILAALLLEVISEAVQKSLNHQIVGFLLMAVVALVCLILIGYFLMRIEKLVENRNYTRFITSKAERLNLMAECIKNAKRSIYIISDLSGTEETELEEHKKYIDALNQVINENMFSKDFEVKRIIVPPYASGMNTETDPDWIYKIPFTEEAYEAYLEHFRLLREKDKASPKHNYIPRNISMILIDNKHLFWKPELTYGDENLDTLLDGGLYLEDYTHEGIADFAERFQDMYDWATPIDLDRLGPEIPKNVDE